MNGPRVLKFSAVTVGVLLVLGFLFLWFWDFSRYKPQLESAVSDATGRAFRINGNFELDILPTPSVLIEDASLSNADWSDAAEMVEVGKASVRVGLWSLLFRPVVVHKLTLSDVKVLLQANADGDTNWNLSANDAEPAAPPEEGGEPEFPIDLRSANISNVTVTYQHPESDDVEFAIESLVVSSEEPDARKIEGNGRWSDLPVGIKGNVADRRSVFEATVGDVRFSSSTEMPDDSVDFSASLGSLADVGKLIELDSMPVEDLSLEGNVALRGDTVVLTNVLASLSGLRLMIDGELDGAENSLRLTVGAEGESLAFLNAELPAIPFSASAEVSLAGEIVTVEPFAARFGESELTGSVQMDGGDKPAVRLDLQSPLVDLTPFSSSEEATEGETSTADTGDEPASQYVFQDEALPFDTLNALDADINVSVKHLRTSTTEIHDLTLEGTVENGVLNVKTAFNGLHGGRFENDLRLASAGDSADLRLGMLAENLKLGTWSGKGVPEDQIPTSNVAVEIQAAGSTPRKLASSTDGRIVLTQGSGRVKNDLIETLSGDVIAQLFNALNPFAKDEEFTDWDCSVFAIDFESGVGDITGLLLQSDKLMVVGGGNIDLNSEQLDIEFNTKPRSGVGVSADMFVTPFVKLSGTLANPSVGLNEKGLLLSGGAAVLTGGLSFLYKGLVDRATAEGGQCEEALESVSDAAVPAAD